MVSSSLRMGGEGLFAVVVDGVMSAAADCSGSGGGAAEVAVEGSVESDMRYWKPWQPPDSTWMRSARYGFLSLDIICERRCCDKGWFCAEVSDSFCSGYILHIYIYIYAV